MPQDACPRFVGLNHLELEVERLAKQKGVQAEDERQAQMPADPSKTARTLAGFRKRLHLIHCRS